MEEYVEYISRSPEDTARISAEIATQLRAGDIILYEGDMGAGKTTFTKGLAAALGITDPVTSPTFALVNEYTEGRLPLFHFDLYRIDSYDDLYAIGFLDYLDRGGIIAAEWSENIEGLEQELAGDSSRTIMKIRIEKTGENERRIKVRGHIVCPLCGSNEILPKNQTSISTTIESKIVSMYAKVMTTSDIQAHIKDIYGMDISDTTVSRITDKILPEAREWQQRPLESVYAVVFMDAIYYHVRSEGQIVKKAV